MKVKQRRGDDERTVLTGMILDTAVCGRIAARWPGPDQPKLFVSKWSNLIGYWCTKHFNKYQEAPNSAIESIYKAWAQGKSHDEDITEPIERLLHSLNDEYERQETALSSEYVLDLAANYFNRVAARNVAELALTDLDAGDPAAAIKRLQAFQTVQISESEGDDPMDIEPIKGAFEGQNKSLIDLPGDAGRFFGNVFARDSFISITAKEKSGKTQWLLHLAWWAMLQRRKVAFFECGDMNRNQLMQRFVVRAANRPLRARTIEYPVGLGWDKELKRVAIETEEKTWEEDLVWQTAYKACQDIMERRIKSTETFFKLFVYPSAAASVSTIEGALDTLSYNGFIPDCIAEGSLVLTDKGLIPIEKVTTNERVWDGAGWVSHDGPVCKGERDVITYAGITATEDHQIWTKTGWRSLGTCARLGLPIAQTGIGRQAIRLGQNYLTENQSTQNQSEEQGVCICSMCAMQENKVDQPMQSSEGDCARLPNMHSAQTVFKKPMGSRYGDAAAMHEQTTQRLETIWRQRNPVQILVRSAGVLMDAEELRCGKQSTSGDRSNRQRRSLRAWESSIINQETKFKPHLQKKMDCAIASDTTSVSVHRVCRFDNPFVRASWCIRCGNNIPMEKVIPSQKKKVWDILNAGPFHRFTVQNVLVHNCVFIDYADLLAPMSKYTEFRHQTNETWKRLRALSQERHCCLITATQADAKSYGTDLLSMANFSDDKRKWGHVTAGIGINVTDRDKHRKMQRINFVVRRDEEFSAKRVLYTAPCLALANPCVRSYLSQSRKNSSE